MKCFSAPVTVMNLSFQVMRELLQPAAVEVPEFDPDLGPAIGKAGRFDECLDRACRCDCVSCCLFELAHKSYKY